MATDVHLTIMVPAHIPAVLSLWLITAEPWSKTTRSIHARSLYPAAEQTYADTTEITRTDSRNS